MFCSFFAPANKGWDGNFPRPIDSAGLVRHVDHIGWWRAPKEREGGVVKLAGSVCPGSSFTCTVDGLDHLVSDDAAARGIAARQGTYTAMCGHVVYVAALVTSAGPLCPHCAKLAQEAEPLVSASIGHDSGRGRARLGRLFGLHWITAP